MENEIYQTELKWVNRFDFYPAFKIMILFSAQCPITFDLMEKGLYKSGLDYG